MTKQYQGMDDLLRDAQNKGQMIFTTHWLLRAVEQRSRNLTIDLAMSVPLNPLAHTLTSRQGKN